MRRRNALRAKNLTAVPLRKAQSELAFPAYCEPLTGAVACHGFSAQNLGKPQLDPKTGNRKPSNSTFPQVKGPSVWS